MNRRAIPTIGMIDYGQEHLRREGCVVMPLEKSVRQDERRLLPHSHEFFQILFMTGSGRLMHDFREHEVDGHTLFFLSPGQVHNIHAGRGMRATVVSFTQAFFDQEAPPPSRLFELPFFFSEVPPWLSVMPTAAPPISRVFDEMQREFDAALPGAIEVLRAALHILFVRASRLYATEHEVKEASRATILVRQFRVQVEHHFREWQAITPYARRLKVTPNHLNDIVREETGHSAGELIRQRRLLDAKRLLLHSDLGVAEIGYQTGFRDPSYFSRFFRRYAEQTPAEFRDQIREKYQ
jgi:AraC-like DNA-binding protein